jgi:hypothetical protein
MSIRVCGKSKIKAPKLAGWESAALAPLTILVEVKTNFLICGNFAIGYKYLGYSGKAIREF